MMNPDFKRGMADTVPVTIGLLPFSLILGAQAAQKGISSLEIGLMMGLNYAGGSEFSAVNAWTNPLPVLVIWGMTLMINCRHILMGAAWVAYLRETPLRKVLPALFFMVDESWAIQMAEIKRREQAGLTPFNWAYYWGIAVILHPLWVVGGLLGAQFGDLLGDHIAEWGFGMAFPAVFLVLVRGMWRGVRAARPWLVSLVVAAVVYRCVPDGAWYVLAGTVSGLMAAYYWAGKA